MSNADFDFIVTDISFVVSRAPDRNWHLDSMCNNNYYIFGFAHSGNALYEISGEEIFVEKGHALFFQKGQIHSAKPNIEDPWSYYSLAFDIHGLTDAGTEDILRIPTVSNVNNFVKYDDTLQRLNRLWTEKSTGYILMCRSLITEILYLLVAENTDDKMKNIHAKKMDSIKSFLAENYDKSYSIYELAEIAGVSESHFRLLFKMHTGYTAIQYQNLMKINKACDILLSGACNITETAYSLGFSDICYFSHLFKKVMGRSPSDFLNRAKQ